MSKYLLYAMGEILLVVIGILIALQVNNWNQRKQAQAEEYTILREIANNLEFDLIDFERNFTHFRNTKATISILIDALGSDAEYHDSLAFHMAYASVFPHFSPNTSGYKLLESKGLELITDDSLRQAITNLYDGYYNYLLAWERERISYNMDNIYPARNRYLGTISIPIAAQPTSIESNSYFDRFISVGGIRELINYEELKRDTEFHSTLKEAETYASMLFEYHTFVEGHVRDLIRQIRDRTG